MIVGLVGANSVDFFAFYNLDLVLLVCCLFALFCCFGFGLLLFVCFVLYCLFETFVRLF